MSRRSESTLRYVFARPDRCVKTDVGRTGLGKIDAHAFSAEEIEAAFDRWISVQKRRADTFPMLAEVLSAPRI
jgi:hypothetical protein